MLYYSLLVFEGLGTRVWDEVSSKDTMGFQSNTPCAVLLGFFALRYLSLSREVTGEQRKGGMEG